MGGNVRYAAFARLSDGLTLASFKGKGATNAVTETAHKVLRSGNHAAIESWRREQAQDITRKRRPDLLASAPRTQNDRHRKEDR